MDFTGKTALVTGAGSGIGRDIVKRLCKLGARVIAVSQTESKLGSLKAENNMVETVVVNLSNWKETESKLGDLCKKVDLLVNNAGCCYSSPVEDVNELDFEHTLAVNLKAPINLIRLVSTGMKERRSGSIVNISSVAGLAALDNHLTYAASKAGLDMATRVCAKELGPFGIRVNSVNPTVVWTEMGRNYWSEPTRRGTMISKIPMGRFVEVNEVIEPVMFLLSNMSSMVNGTVMPVDGGFVAC